MKRTFTVLLTLLTIVACKVNKSTEKEIIDVEIPRFIEFITPNYELYKSSINVKAVLVLFGGYPEKAEDIKREFKILEEAKSNAISVLFMTYNQKLWIEENEKLQLAEELQKIFKEHKLPTNNIYVGGFSSGGNVTLLISDFVTKKKLDITPKGVFIVDSPVDLAELYNSAIKNIERNFSEPAVQESTWILESLGKQFGNPNNDISKYEEHSIFTLKTDNIDNIKNLNKTKIRLYTEPDTIWWKKNRMADYEQLNAYKIKRLSETLNKLDFNSVEYIPTKDKGYRANGERHPHSWAIVNKKDLINWILNK